MMNVFWRSSQDKGFIYSLDAIIACIIIITITSSLMLLVERECDLNKVFLYQQAQDLIEVCSKKEELTEECFDFLKEANPSLDYCLKNCENYEVLIKRHYNEDFEFGITKALLSS